MIRRIIPLALFTLSTVLAVAQAPKAVKSGALSPTLNPSMACPPGASPDAGISTQNLFPSAQSNDVLFLCMGDSMDVQHFGGDLSGDPVPATPPGFTYVFYNCPPTNSGPTADDILNDPCHIVILPGSISAVQSDIDIDGNATFFNQGQAQAALNAGNPVQVWFAPFTLDNFATFSTEPDGTGVQGPCINVNTTDAFSVTYLNAIEGTNIDVAADGNCTASFTVTGGLPEFDGSDYTNVSVTLSTDPTVVGNVDGVNFTHNEVITFTVPQAGIYNVLVEDDKSCAASFTIDMTGCSEVIFDASEEFGSPGSTVCVQIDVSGFTNVLSFQYTINWDPAVLQLPTPITSSVNDLNALPDPIFFGPANPTNSLTVNWSDVDFMGESLPDGTTIFEICFTLIGPAGSSSPITFSGNPTQIEVLNPAFQTLGFNGQAGSVNIAGAITLTFTSCSSLQGGADVGSFTVTASGGVPPYNFTWVNLGNPGINGSGGILFDGGTDIIGDNIPGGDVPLPPGTYEVTLSGSNGDPPTVATVEIFNVEPLVVSLSSTNPTCFDSPDGTASLSTANLGGVNPLSIVWSTMETDVDNIGGLVSGIYAVTVTDAAGCVDFDQIQLTTPPIIIDTVSLQHVTCNGPGNDGAIIVQASGGVVAPGSDYDYAWDNGGVGPNINFLTPGNYCVSVTDDNLCEIVHCITINAPMPPVIIGFDSVSVACPLDMNGELTVNAVPGNSAIDSYTWDPAQPGANETITNLGPGTYNVTVTAVDGCIATGSATLFAPTAMVFDSAQTVSPNCPGDVNGSITVFVSGGTEPYTYTWNTGAVSNFPLLPGLVGDSTYTVTVTDSGMCGDTVIQDILLEDPPEIMVAFTNLGSVMCNGGLPCDGQATALASGGTGTTGLYNFNWPSGETFNGVAQSTAMQLCQGALVLEVNDGLCSVTVDTIIEAPALLTIDSIASFTTQTSCFGTSDGAAVVQGQGGIPGYTYQWINPNVTGPSISNVPAGTYSVVITDANGCTVVSDATVNEPDLLVASMADTIDAQCEGSADGQLTASWTGGNPGNATYAWTNNVSTTSVATGLVAGSYTVTITDENGCNDIATGFVDEPPAIFFIIDTIVDPLCFGFQTFITIDTAFGGEGGNNVPFSFSVDGGPRQPVTTGSIAVLAGNHTVAVFDATQMCSSEEEITINQPPPLTVNLGDDQTIELGDSIDLEPTIGSFLPIDSILWTPLTALTCLDSACSEVNVMPLETTAYSVVAIDVNGCTGTDDIIIDVDKNRNVYIPNIFTPDGDGLNDVFRIFTGLGVEKVNYMRVYDRWGEQVYQVKEFIPADFGNPGWDGFFKGKVMNPGVFVYLIEVEFTDGIVLVYRGDVTLIH